MKEKWQQKCVSQTYINVEPKTLVGVVKVAADDEDANVSSDVDDTVAVGVAVVLVDVTSCVDSTTVKRNRPTVMIVIF